MVQGFDRVGSAAARRCVEGYKCYIRDNINIHLSIMTNVDSILNYTRTEEEDYYAILGCDESSTVSVKVKFYVTDT